MDFLEVSLNDPMIFIDPATKELFSKELLYNEYFLSTQTINGTLCTECLRHYKSDHQYSQVNHARNYLHNYNCWHFAQTALEYNQCAAALDLHQIVRDDFANEYLNLH